MPLPDIRTLLALADDAVAAARAAGTDRERAAWIAVAEGWLDLVELSWPADDRRPGQTLH